MVFKDISGRNRICSTEQRLAYFCRMSSVQSVRFRDLGNMDYQEAWDLQEGLLQENVLIKRALTSGQTGQEGIPSRSTTHHLLFVEHPPVLTLGKSGKEEHLLLTPAQLQSNGVQYIKTNRGGDITFHGPGQLVGYPILDLERFYTDIGRYLRNVEEVIILTLAEYGLKGERSPGETGVWLDPFIKGKERKICAIGVRCSRWVSMHGFALNVNTDLDYFNFIVPCGIQGKAVTSLQKELGHPVPFSDVKEIVKRNFEKVFESNLEEAE